MDKATLARQMKAKESGHKDCSTQQYACATYATTRGTTLAYYSDRSHQRLAPRGKPLSDAVPLPIPNPLANNQPEIPPSHQLQCRLQTVHHSSCPPPYSSADPWSVAPISGGPIGPTPGKGWLPEHSVEDPRGTASAHHSTGSVETRWCGPAPTQPWFLTVQRAEQQCAPWARGNATGPGAYEDESSVGLKRGITRAEQLSWQVASYSRNASRVGEGHTTRLAGAPLYPHASQGTPIQPSLGYRGP